MIIVVNVQPPPDFQLTYAPQAWSAEKLAWRAVIFLNLVRAINTICDAVRREIEFSNVRQKAVGSSGSLNLSLSRGIDEEEELQIEVEDVLSDASHSTSPPHSPIVSPSSSTFSPALSEPASSPIHVSLPSLSTPPHPLTTHHSDLVTRLESLKVVQKELERRLGAGSGEDYGAFGPPGVFLNAEGGGGDPEKEDHGFGAVGQTSYALARPRRQQEFFVRSTGWKKLALAHARDAYASFKPRLSTSSRWGTSNRHHDEQAVDESQADSDTDWIEDVVREVVKRREVMKTVWADRAVREVVRKRKVGVGEAGEL